ncbi:MAG TPA: hypothetical protein VMG10_17435 [Gemmataceae bacterium]|nr:hypothetical protein [Gemmataceae bacterium]
MKARGPWIAAVTLLIGTGSAFAQVKDVVELLPAETLACIELRQPARLAREVAFLVKGSSLDDLPKRMAKLHGSNPDYRYYLQRELLSMLSVFLSPEAINEGGRIGGGFIALTGFAKDDTPEVVGVLQTGSSNLPGMIMRGFLTSSRTHIVGEIESVPMYREVMRIYRKAAAGQANDEERESGPVVAQLPGLLLFGSSVDSLKDVIRRAKSKSGAASLTNLRAFKEAAALRDRPGLFAYVDVAALEAKLDEMAARSENPRSTTWIAVVKSFLGERAIRSFTFSLTLHNSTLEGQTRFTLNDKSDSPLLDLLPDRAAQRELLHFAPIDALLALTGGLGDSEKRWKTFVNLLDALYKLEGRPGDNRPSRTIQEMEKKLRFQIEKDVLAELSGAGIVVHKDWRHKPGQATLLLRAADEKAAAKLEKSGLPRLFSFGAEEARMPNEAEVRGQRIKTLPGKKGGLGLPFAVSYGRQGAVLVLGTDRELVAESLIAGSKKAGLLGETKVAAAVKEIDDKAVAVGVLSSARAAMDLFAVMSRPRFIMKAPAPGQAPGMVEQPPAPSLESTKTGQALLKVAEPLVFTLNRQSDRLELKIQPLLLRRMTPRLLDVWIETLLQPLGEAGAGGASR